MKTSKEVYDGYAQVALGKTTMHPLKMVISGIFAGAFIAMGGLGSQIASSAIGGAGGKVVGACVFPIGLFLVVTIGVELFTGNCLLTIPAYSKHLQPKVKFSGVLTNWLFVYIGNFIGSLLVALAVYYGGTGGLFDGKLSETAMAAAASKISLPFEQALIRGIMCNILVCLAVWVAMEAKSVPGKAIAVFGPVMLFVAAGFEHSVANMYFVPLGMLYDQSLSMGDFFLNNLLPVTLGNIVGGALIVSGGLSIILKPAKKN
ncbi:MAG: formate/nitrite transporter family protein [Eubacterium sp.]|nr:formate/nitrite transporter family protein [Eubacterium sp.]